MASEAELRDRFWEELSDSPFVMIGLMDEPRRHSQPMTAYFDRDYPGALHFYASRDGDLFQSIIGGEDAMVHFVAKGHDLFACVAGHLVVETDETKIDRFWNPVAAAFYDKGREDPNLVMLRFDAGEAQIWKADKGNFITYLVKGLIGETAGRDHDSNVARTTL